jgi:HTH-type transcriptional regulator/antitoxin HigA
MDIRPIKTEKDHDWALKEIQRLWSAKPGSAEEDRMMVLVTLVEAFEGEHYAMDLPDPIEAIKFRMEQQGLSRADLEPMIGSRGRVSEIMNRSRSLTMAMIRKLHAALNIPAEILIRETALPPCRLELERMPYQELFLRVSASRALPVANRVHKQFGNDFHGHNV